MGNDPGRRGSKVNKSESSRVNRPLTGIAFKVVSVTVFVAMSSLIKAAGPLPAGQIVFFRSFFAMLPILAFLGFRQELRTAFHTKRPLNHIARGMVGVTAMGLGFFALTRLPLPEAITLNYAQPLLVVVFSSIILGETIRFYRWSAVVVGLIGVCIISWPKLTLFGAGAGMGNDEMLGVIAAIVGAAVSALAMIVVRSLVHTERTGTIVLWFSLTSTVLALCTYPLGWSALTFQQAALLIIAGCCGGLGQLLMTEAYRYAEASTVAPFEYTSMIFGLAVGYYLFGDVPTIHMLVGGLIVVGAGIFIIWRERQLGLERRAVRQVAPSQA
ncbi:DMT family transporter [Pseudaminobacter soli (ex Li et al. 2025)]|uniref:EamA family transporter n=1 Tax=Pseudaminobacter soli (ex Li et al. 2025) TaxID=1295366 RepID=A0A2P7SFP4_9HYPH|nr:DMT family transporter [Mesorhizobium soli]PSJ61319.1 EamA family transporter [Mesorhizobium soli]